MGNRTQRKLRRRRRTRVHLADQSCIAARTRHGSFRSSTASSALEQPSSALLRGSPAARDKRHVGGSIFLFSLLSRCRFSFSRVAFADSAPHGRIALSNDRGAGPLVLAKDTSAQEESLFKAEFTIANNGDDPLFVSRVAPRGDDTDVRSPSKLSAKFVEGNGASATIAPHASKARRRFIWTPDHDARVKQLFGENHYRHVHRRQRRRGRDGRARASIAGRSRNQ